MKFVCLQYRLSRHTCWTLKLPGVIRIATPYAKLSTVSSRWINAVTCHIQVYWNYNIQATTSRLWQMHYDDVIMTMLESQITSPTVVYSIVYSGVHQRKHQSSASLAFVREIHREPVNFPHKWPVTRKMFPFDDVIMAMTPFTVECFISQILSTKVLFCNIKMRVQQFFRGIPHVIPNQRHTYSILLMHTPKINAPLIFS